MLLKVLAVLSLASSITAAPAGEVRGNRTPFAPSWWIVGYSSPGCEGEGLWHYEGVDYSCTNVQTQAASVWVGGWAAEFRLAPIAACPADGNSKRTNALLESSFAGEDDVAWHGGTALSRRFEMPTFEERCIDLPVLAFMVTPDP
ncbi:hypothetical protein VTK26DRAFT_1744 [Humicola hyalothermophila]